MQCDAISTHGVHSAVFQRPRLLEDLRVEPSFAKLSTGSKEGTRAHIVAVYLNVVAMLVRVARTASCVLGHRPQRSPSNENARERKETAERN